MDLRDAAIREWQGEQLQQQERDREFRDLMLSRFLDDVSFSVTTRLSRRLDRHTVSVEWHDGRPCSAPSIRTTPSSRCDCGWSVATFGARILLTARRSAAWPNSAGCSWSRCPRSVSATNAPRLNYPRPRRHRSDD